MNTLEEKHFGIVTDLLMGLTAQKVAKECTDITIEFAKGFYEWARKERYEMYWGSDQPNSGKWYVSYTMPDRKYFTTDELITTYINSLKQ